MLLSRDPGVQRGWGGGGGGTQASRWCQGQSQARGRDATGIFAEPGLSSSQHLSRHKATRVAAPRAQAPPKLAAHVAPACQHPSAPLAAPSHASLIWHRRASAEAVPARTLRQNESLSIHRLSHSDLMPGSNLGEGWQRKHQTQPHGDGEAPAGAGITAPTQHRSPAGTSEPRTWPCRDTPAGTGLSAEPSFHLTAWQTRVCQQNLPAKGFGARRQRAEVPRQSAFAPL